MRMTVDLASKFSAVVVVDADGGVHRQFDSAGKSAFEFCQEIRQAAVDFDPDVILVEDVPYGISSQAMTKPVLRLQGILIRYLANWLDRVVFINPSTWQRDYEGVATAPRDIPKGKQRDVYRQNKAKEHAAARGYSPPDLVAAYVATLPEGTRVLKKHTDPLEKSMTDYIDAFLMTDWLSKFETIEDLYKVKGCQPVFI
jgi:hypothetical protein